MLSLLFMAAQAATAAAAPVQCTIVEEKAEAGLLLIGACGKSGVLIGLTDSYESVKNPGTGTVAAIVQRMGQRHVLLVRPDADEKAFLEDLTGDVARQGGRVLEAGLDGLAISLSRFAAEGVIDVRTSNASKSAATATGQISAAALIEHEAIRRTLPKEPSRVVEVIAEGRGPETK